MNSPINIGILGYGYMGEIRKKYLDLHPKCKVKSIFHTNKLNGDFFYFNDWKEIITDESLDAIFVCLPNYLTKEAVVMSLEAGKHVFAEKPPGISASQVKEMIVAEKKSGKKLKFGFNHRYHPAIIKAKELVNSEKFGNILWLRGRYGKSVDENFSSNWRSQKKYAGGGILMDQGIHMADLFLYFCGDFQEAKAYASNLYWKGDVEDNLFAILRNNKGQVASLHSTMTQWRYLFALEIFLERGYITINGLLSKSGRYGPERIDYSVDRTPAPMASHSESRSLIFNTDLSWELEIQEFVQAILEDKEIRIGNSSDALKLMTLIERIYSNADVKLV